MLNALRHQRNCTVLGLVVATRYYRAQRLAASEELHFQGLVHPQRKKGVLNALRHQRNCTICALIKPDINLRAQRLAASEELHLPIRCPVSIEPKCSTPCGIRGIALVVFQPLTDQTLLCSTPCGIRGIAPPLWETTSPIQQRAQRLAASEELHAAFCRYPQALERAQRLAASEELHEFFATFAGFLETCSTPCGIRGIAPLVAAS